MTRDRFGNVPTISLIQSSDALRDNDVLLATLHHEEEEDDDDEDDDDHTTKSHVVKVLLLHFDKNPS